MWVFLVTQCSILLCSHFKRVLLYRLDRFFTELNTVVVRVFFGSIIRICIILCLSFFGKILTEQASLSLWNVFELMLVFAFLPWRRVALNWLARRHFVEVFEVHAGD